MDADYDPNMETQQTKRKGKKQSKLTRALKQQKPLFDPNEKTFEEYFDEYYKLDYEDIIGDLPCRFKYRNVLPNDFGLSTQEVLSYPERELNQWVSVKRMSQYRTNEEERLDVRKYRKFGRDERRKRRIFSSTATPSAETSTPETKQSTTQKDPTKHTTDVKTTEQERKLPKEKQQNNDRKPSQQQETKPDRKCNEKQRISQLKRKGWKRRLTPKEAKEQAQKKKLARQFKGAKQDKLAGLTVDRLAAYGLKKKRKVSDS